MTKIGNRTKIWCPHCESVEDDYIQYLYQGYKQLYCVRCGLEMPEAFARNVLKLIQNEKNSSKKEKQTKDINSPKKTLESSKGDIQKKVRTCLLYLLPNGTYRSKLTTRPPLAKGQSWSVSEVRYEGLKIPMFSLQSASWGKRSDILSQNVARKRRKVHDRTLSRSSKDSKGRRPLSKVNRRISKDIRDPLEDNKLYNARGYN